jgi:hypothetical protein
MSCNSFFKSEPLSILKKYTSINFLQQDVEVVKFEEKKAGMAEETSLLAVYRINKTFNIDSLRRDGKMLEYQSLPISNMDLGNGFDGNLIYTDKGYYRYKNGKNPFKDELVIINITQNKIIISANY